MRNLNACITCLSTTAKLHPVDAGSLRCNLNLLIGLQTVKTEASTDQICFECQALVKKFVKFRDKCLRSHFALKTIRKEGKNQEAIISNLDLEAMGIKASLNYMDPNKVHYEIVQYQPSNKSLNKEYKLNIPTTVFSTYGDTFEINENIVLPTDVEIDDIDIKSENNDDDILVNYDDDDYDIDDKMIFNKEFKRDEVFKSEEEFKSDGEESKVDIEEFKSDGEEDEYNKVYATLVTITNNEARAVHEILQKHSKGNYECNTCLRKFKTENLLRYHSRMHDLHISGKFECDLCHNRYKSDFLLQVHISDHHKYKYICTKCPEVNFDRDKAKSHYLLMHLKKGKTTLSDDRPKWLRKRSKIPRQAPLKKQKQSNNAPDYPIRKVVDQLTQYQMVYDRQLTKNYKSSPYKCDLCFKGHRELKAFEDHMKKHNPNICGTYQCDMCKQYLRNPRKMYRHVVSSHLYVYECRYCSYRCSSRGQSMAHYKSHKNVKYPCPFCNLQFIKPTSRMTHIRTKHPTTVVCNLCGHSFVSEYGLTIHKKMKHLREEVEDTSTLSRGALGTETDIYSGKTTEVGYCPTCDMQFANEAAFLTHLESSSNHVQTNLATKPVRSRQERRPIMSNPDPNKPRRRRQYTEIVNTGLKSTTICDLCGLELKTDKAAKKHYARMHPGAEFIKKRYMCDICGHTTQVYSNLQVHMRRHTQEKPYGCPHCDRRFSMPGNRDRHLLVHTGEKKYQCPTCLRRFTQNVALKLHIQTVHMKIPYEPWIKKNRKRKKDMDTIMTNSVVAAPPTISVPEPKLHIEATVAGEGFANYVITYVNHSLL